jgi:hypothetical protein
MLERMARIRRSGDCSKGGVMLTAKQQVEELLRRLHDDCTFEDIQDDLYVLEKIWRAEKSIITEGPVSHEEAKRRMQQWP